MYGAGFDELIARDDGSGNAAWYLTDRLGSVREVVSDSGTTLGEATYTGFGAGTVTAGVLDRFRFTGREWDEAIELQYSRARVYDPDTGRFLSDDPIGFRAGDVNLGRYVGNNATGGTDPSGMFDIKGVKEELIRRDRQDIVDWMSESKARFDYLNRTFFGRRFRHTYFGTVGEDGKPHLSIEMDFNNAQAATVIISMVESTVWDRAIRDSFTTWNLERIESGRTSASTHYANARQELVTTTASGVRVAMTWYMVQSPVVGVMDIVVRLPDGDVTPLDALIALPAVGKLTGALNRGAKLTFQRSGKSYTYTKNQIDVMRKAPGSKPNFIGNSQGLSSNQIPLKIPVTRQPSGNTCVPSSLDMLLEYYVPARGGTNIENYRLSRAGMNPADAVIFIDDNLAAIGMRTIRSDLPDAIKSGQPFIAFVYTRAEGHAVLVQGIKEIKGIRYVIVRDPAKGSYLEKITDFDARLVRDKNVIGWPTIRGER